jgi:hypothetical protein
MVMPIAVVTVPLIKLRRCMPVVVTFLSTGVFFSVELLFFFIGKILVVVKKKSAMSEPSVVYGEP